MLEAEYARRKAVVESGQTDIQRWLEEKQYSSAWKERAIAAVRSEPGARWFCDLGCGQQFVGTILPVDSIYLLCDLRKWSGDTAVFDANKKVLPKTSLHLCDVCFILGLLEYVYDLEWFCRTMLIGQSKHSIQVTSRSKTVARWVGSTRSRPNVFGTPFNRPVLRLSDGVLSVIRKSSYVSRARIQDSCGFPGPFDDSCTSPPRQYEQEDDVTIMSRTWVSFDCVTSIDVRLPQLAPTESDLSRTHITAGNNGNRSIHGKSHPPACREGDRPWRRSTGPRGNGLSSFMEKRL